LPFFSFFILGLEVRKELGLRSGKTRLRSYFRN